MLQEVVWGWASEDQWEEDRSVSGEAGKAMERYSDAVWFIFITWEWNCERSILKYSQTFKKK